MRERLPVLAGTAAGLVAAVVVTLLQSSTYRADASIVLVRQGQPPGSDPALTQAAEAAAELFDSRAVAEPVIANLRLEESPDALLERVSVETEPESSLVRIEVDAPRRAEARRTAQEVVEVATVLFNDRFGPQTVASVWEASREHADPVSPKPVRNLALGALLGALAGWILLAFGRGRGQMRGRVRSRPRVEPAVRLEPAAPAVAPDPEPVTAPPEPPPLPAGPFVPPRLGEWTVHDVERLLAEQESAFPDRADELRVYLDSFRDVAEPDGRLPGGVEAVMDEVFRDLIERAVRKPS
jgi:capsular polysaccharide biosynthesis protein